MGEGVATTGKYSWGPRSFGVKFVLIYFYSYFLIPIVIFLILISTCLLLLESEAIDFYILLFTIFIKLSHLFD